MGFRLATWSMMFVFAAGFTERFTVCPEYKARYEIIEKLNVYDAFEFELMWTSDISEAFYSPAHKTGNTVYYPYTLVFYRSRQEASRSYREKANNSMPIFQYGGVQAWLPYGDWNNLNEKVRTIMVGMGYEVQ